MDKAEGLLEKSATDHELQINARNATRFRMKEARALHSSMLCKVGFIVGRDAGKNMQIVRIWYLSGISSDADTDDTPLILAGLRNKGWAGCL
jgi:hypothetical protein